MAEIHIQTMRVDQELLIPQIQEKLDGEMQGRVVQHNALTGKVGELVNLSQNISLALLRDTEHVAFHTIEADYQNLLRNAKQLLPSFGERLTPITWDKSNPQGVNEQVQNQMEYFQLLCNNEQTKETNLLDLSLKNYFAISNTLSEIAKTLFGFIKHVLGNSTGR